MFLFGLYDQIEPSPKLLITYVCMGLVHLVTIAIRITLSACLGLKVIKLSSAYCKLK
jgi:hypothetical protein